MKSLIRVLSEKVVSQIAAGEVVERPASVVRELLDNSIDAESNRITIRIENGGKRLIRVTDNGVGMTRDDLLLCLERHATSKIRDIHDLPSITTLGFRGEALPSIAAVSRTQITSRPADELIGNKLKVNGGKFKSIDETGSPTGTDVEVRDLFFNVPARRKFLRTVKTETDHIIDALTRITLPYNRIHVKLEETGKTLLNLPGTENPLNRLSALFGRDVAASMTEDFIENGEMAVRTYLASPELSRNRGDRIFIYVNGRNIRDRLITRAIMEGYGQRLMKGRYPQLVLYIEIDPTFVDVNVHPTKQEIRFHHGQMVFQTIMNTIAGSFGTKVAPHYEMETSRPGPGTFKQTASKEMAEPEWAYSGEETKESFLSTVEFKQQNLVKEIPQVLGQLKETYILCQTGDGLLMVDQHAAHERVVYETLKRSHQQSNIEGQSFLIPHKLELSLKEGRAVLKYLDQLVKMGLELEHFGGSTFLLRSVPSILLGVNWDDFIRDLIPLLEEEGDITRDRALDKLLTIMACHGAIRAGQRLSHREMGQLLNQLEEADLSTNCPHGRPVLKKFSYGEIEKMFKRIV
jgi:DNA mismatch repair protein MutL